MTSAAVIAVISLTIIGLVYQCNTMLPSQNKHLHQKILLGITHLLNTAGIGIATYAGSPSATGEGGVANQTLNRVGNVLLLTVLAIIYGWMWPTWRKMKRYQGVHPNVAPVRWLFFAAMTAMPFWLVRLVSITTYAFAHTITSLDPVMGSYGTKLLLVFGMYVLASAALLVGGWYGVPKVAPGTPAEYRQIEQEFALARGNSNGIEMVDQQGLK
ncbi:hypothetical protein N0V93_000832 [Gnomoniopsis smithogilvyi]|uniref:DUF7702 domain-containing protein n=1 Tax=Gnomoniopsis smithogilvyi TaxID=1191159 RepID=A0A9W8Z0G3_9PEZI|nr:hypothetical protein N0V93_000832 [Gnomoniopsis smithogilvyi]